MNTLSEWIEKHADFIPDKAAINFEGRTITYSHFSLTVRDYARTFKHIYGLGRGDRLTFLGFNTPEFIFAMFACARLGAIFSPLNWRLTTPELVYILTNSGSKFLVCDEEHQLAGEKIRDQLTETDLVAVDFSEVGWCDLQSDIKVAEGDDKNPHVSADTPFLLVYTSGTTGHPKGAILTQEAIAINALNGIHLADMNGQDHILTSLPMFHVGGLNIQTVPAFYVGATVTLHRRFDAASVLRDLQELQITLCVLVPATIQALIKLSNWNRASFSSLKTVLVGSSIVPRQFIDAFHDKDVPVTQMYGLTETAPIAVYLRAEDAVRKAGSTGKAALHCDMRIVDETNKDVTKGLSGEIIIKGKNIMYEYWGNEEATRDALKDGWFYTGDIGYEDGEGYVWINDRKKDVVISGGENIYPAELEQFIHQMDDIEDATVVGRPDDRWGEVPVAVVIMSPNKRLNPTEFLERFENQLARFKHPKDVIFVDNFPRNAMGKVLKHEVRKLVGNQ